MLGGAGLVLALIVYALGAFLLYWVIRLAVRHALRDAGWERHRPPGPPYDPDHPGPPR